MWRAHSEPPGRQRREALPTRRQAKVTFTRHRPTPPEIEDDTLKNRSGVEELLPKVTRRLTSEDQETRLTFTPETNIFLNPKTLMSRPTEERRDQNHQRE